MSGRTYVVIFFFWAALTVITPTLVFLSETSKPYSDSNGEEIEGTKGRRLIGIVVGYEAQRRPRVLPTTEAPAASASASASPSRAQAPVSELKPGLKHGETSLVKVFIESLRFVINNTKFKLN